MMKSVFNAVDVTELKARIDQLSPATRPVWGQMTPSQMMAHCNVSYEMTYEDIHPKPNPVMKFIIKLAAKKTVVGPKPYPKSMTTAPIMKITGDKDFETEKKRLVDYLHKTEQLGEAHFDGRESHSFGKLSKDEWNMMFYKHLDHHLQQFGV